MELMQQDYSEMRAKWPEKFVSLDRAFSHIHAGDRIFIGTGCGEPQFLVQALADYVREHPKAFFDTEILHVWTLGAAPYTDIKFRENFRLNTFFIGRSTRDAVNKELADYTPIFFSAIPDLIYRGRIPIDVALIQTTPPDRHGYLNLGISVDIVKAAVEKASVVIAQINSNMPRVQGDGFIHMDDVSFVIPHDEPLLEYVESVPTELAQQIGRYVARIVEDGSTIEVGYGMIPNAVLANLKHKKHLGIHTSLLTDGFIELMKVGAVDNSMKTIDRYKTIASFCMGTRKTYEYIHDNPAIEFKTIDYTNNPLIIAKNRNMVSINSAMEVDLTGQATAESLGTFFHSGIGGQADFMRGAVLSPGGKAILALPSTAENGRISRIVPMLREGAGVTLTRGDLHYVVTEYGIAYLHGKNVRERAMDLIALAHPKFRPWLLEEAKRLSLIYPDQQFIPGEKGEYPEHLETYRTTKTGINILLRPVRITDEPLLKDFFYSLSDETMYQRFASARKGMSHKQLQDFVVIDYTREMVILAVVEEDEREVVVGLGQYSIAEGTHTAEVAIVVRDDYQRKGVGMEILSYLVYLARKQGLFYLNAEVLVENQAVLRMFERLNLRTERKLEGGVYSVKIYL
ncbi:MAG: GNAT family N-acetyltransferase [Methanothrix sp.]